MPCAPCTFEGRELSELSANKFLILAVSSAILGLNRRSLFRKDAERAIEEMHEKRVLAKV